MNWLNLKISVMSSEGPKGATSAELGTWLRLVCYCAQQENGGTIKAARDWNPRQWMAIIGVTEEEIAASTSLWTWKDDALTIWNYPSDHQERVERLRDIGGRSAKGKPKANSKAEGGPEGGACATPEGVAQGGPNSNSKYNGKDKKKDKHTLSYQSAEADEREREWEKVWSAFPKRIDEKKARAVYLESDVSPQRLIDSLADWSQTDEWTRDNGRWIPAPARWLERAGWTEQPPQITRKEKEPVRCTL
jgi:hypothetical protein